MVCSDHLLNHTSSVHCLPFPVPFPQVPNGAAWDQHPNNLLVSQVLVLGSSSGPAQAKRGNYPLHSLVSFYVVKVALTHPNSRDGRVTQIWPTTPPWLFNYCDCFRDCYVTPSRPRTTSFWISVGTIEKENIFLLWSLNFRMLAWGSTFSESEATSEDSSVEMEKSNSSLMTLSISLVPWQCIHNFKCPF